MIDKSIEFCRERGKKLLFCMFCPTALCQTFRGEARHDQEIADYLGQKGQLVFDMNRVHIDDFACFKLSEADYMKRYFIGHYGHYSPAGNHFFAYSIKDKIVDWLDPKPITYRDDETKVIDFEGYLPK